MEHFVGGRDRHLYEFHALALLLPGVGDQYAVAFDLAPPLSPRRAELTQAETILHEARLLENNKLEHTLPPANQHTKSASRSEYGKQEDPAKTGTSKLTKGKESNTAKVVADEISKTNALQVEGNKINLLFFGFHANCVN
jgi:hypothetical protein